MSAAAFSREELEALKNECQDWRLGHDRQVRTARVGFGFARCSLGRFYTNVLDVCEMCILGDENARAMP